MAGYISKAQGYIFEGELVNGTGAGVKNGSIVVFGTGDDAGKLVYAASADTTTQFLCKEVAEIYDGMPAYRFIVNKLNDNYYFVENGFEYYNDGVAYDNREHEVPNGKFLRAHPLVVGEEFVTNMVTGTPAAGTAYGVKTDGTVG